MDLILLFIPSTASLERRCLVHARIPSICLRSLCFLLVCPSPISRQLDKTADRVAEPLFHPSVGPNHYGNQVAVSTGLI